MRRPPRQAFSTTYDGEHFHDYCNDKVYHYDGKVFCDEYSDKFSPHIVYHCDQANRDHVFPIIVYRDDRVDYDDFFFVIVDRCDHDNHGDYDSKVFCVGYNDLLSHYDGEHFHDVTIYQVFHYCVLVESCLRDRVMPGWAASVALSRGRRCRR